MFCVQTGNTLPDILINILIFAVGTAVLVKGCDWFIDAAADLARRWHVSEIVIGLTLVSIGTSLPELASSVYAATQGEGDFIIGNIVGSNVTNISLILAIGIIGMGQMPFERKILARDGLFMLIVYFVCAMLFAFLPVRSEIGSVLHGIDFRGAILLLILCASYIFLLFHQEKSAREEALGEEAPGKGSVLTDLAFLALGIVMITAGAKGMVDPVVWGAERLGISVLVISSTIVAFGTSVPELAVTLAGIVKKRHEIALGNIIGSNIFNILLIFGVTGCITRLPMESNGIALLNLILMGVTGLMLIFFLLTGKTRLVRSQGVILLLVYLVFMVCNVCAAIRG